MVIKKWIELCVLGVKKRSVTAGKHEKNNSDLCSVIKSFNSGKYFLSIHANIYSYCNGEL